MAPIFTISLYIHHLNDVYGNNYDVITLLADRLHSLGLKSTWYVAANPERGFTDEFIQLFNYYKSLGDDIQLSLGNVFFSMMYPDGRFSYLTPRPRREHVDFYVNQFKQAFGDPSLIEAHYVDADTLTYITEAYPTIKGGPVYCNHEFGVDLLETKGGYYMPYYPSRYNTMVPATGGEKLPFVAMPYFHRDLTNCLKTGTSLANLCPQDYGWVQNQLRTDWRVYFNNLLDSYLTGWTPFNLALYALDIPMNIRDVLDMVETDFLDLKTRIDVGQAENWLDKDFVNWFINNYRESPSYLWRYIDPSLISENLSEWSFTPQNRVGVVDGRELETRRYLHYQWEPCINRDITYYVNNMPLITPTNILPGLMTATATATFFTIITLKW